MPNSWKVQVSVYKTKQAVEEAWSIKSKQQRLICKLVQSAADLHLTSYVYIGNVSE